MPGMFIDVVVVPEVAKNATLARSSPRSAP
jgi:hypothetical protein